VTEPVQLIAGHVVVAGAGKHPRRREVHVVTGATLRLAIGPDVVFVRVLSFAKRTSLFGRNTWNGPNSPSSSSSAVIGPFTLRSKTGLLASQ
jgi:hypothetical protein